MLVQPCVTNIGTDTIKTEIGHPRDGGSYVIASHISLLVGGACVRMRYELEVQ